MKTIVDEKIDIEIKRILSNLDIEIEDHGEIPFNALEALKAYLGFKENDRYFVAYFCIQLYFSISNT